jgi:hypothetical protein
MDGKMKIPITRRLLLVFAPLSGAPLPPPLTIKQKPGYSFFVFLVVFHYTGIQEAIHETVLVPVWRKLPREYGWSKRS